MEKFAWIMSPNKNWDIKRFNHNLIGIGINHIMAKEDEIKTSKN